MGPIKGLKIINTGLRNEDIKTWRDVIKNEKLRKRLKLVFGVVESSEVRWRVRNTHQVLTALKKVRQFVLMGGLKKIYGRQ